MYKQVYWSSSARRSLKLAHQNKGKNPIKQEQPPKNDSPLPAPAESENESSVPVVAEPENETPAFKAVKEEITTAVRGLKAIPNYLEEDCVRFLQVIDEISSDHLSIRDKIGDLLADLEYHEVVLQIFKQFNRLEVIETENIKTWVLLYYTTTISTNYTDSSEKFSMCLEKSEAVEQLTELFKHTEYDDDLENNGLKYGVFTNILITLHNIVRFSGIKFHYKEAKTAEKVMPLIGVKNEFICSVAMLLLAYIIDEDENDKIVDENNIIIYIVTWLSQSLDHPSRRARGFTPWELTRGLSKLAVNDSNKKKIIEANALPEFSKMISFNDARELENTTECLWTLCFDKSARQVIKDFPGLVTALDSLKNSDNEKIRKNAKGALWLINEEKEASKVTDNVGEDVGQHIFISYSWAEKTKVKEIYKSLKSHGFKVWVDWENMGGSTLQAMAEAVENASVVLICVSENYKLSNNCRLEAEYTFTKKRNYLPLVMQKQYKADGWLGIMLGSKLYYDFSGKYPYEQSEQQLLKALQELEITRPTLEPMPASKESQSTVSCYKMTNAEVVEWLEKKGLQRLSSLLYNINGKMLWDMKLFSETAPEYFFKEIKDQYELSLVEVIQFNSALKTLH
ncbi:uncharacterized protein LOC106059582 [Biomphalaria glabrata]|uniref:Uncharacterized protein LOC106059582 n=1 Tax=Biomphalaria glabrata TaxID=6526 RepID=A0A9W2YC92_BIOGL|nr:uncharacterized protein LOC106059582 [Biomphalaria glabrata]XP_055860342.1 uncharacterized protein LOC106059582 [Biomphalaria glabrata]XP_055860343.1 uncharacterized protein LOC106059582 [Biomphalaria glabrata]XP_055860344.1 uncharacterized protein LOC106059582 [Biomphalaria glabrata]